MAVTTSLASTWQEAFETHPIPIVRSFEKQLRAGAVREREKLRGLVGNNYRDLLATAEQIIDLDDQTRNAESSISTLSQSCKVPERDAVDGGVFSTPAAAGQIRLLDQMIRCAARAVKIKSVMLASRLIVLSRLLLKSLDALNVEAPLSQWLQSRAKVLRGQLLTTIDALLVKPNITTRGLQEAAVAYCLTTSSSLTDAVKHLQGLRQRKLSSSLANTSDTAPSRSLVRQKCQYLIVSVAAIRTLSGRGTSEMLRNIQKRPLLQDPELNGLETLHLDLYGNLLPDEIVSFIPYLKHVPASPAETRSSLTLWVETCMASILTEIKGAIARAGLPKTLQIRDDVFNVLLPSCFTSYLHKSVIDKIRAVISSRIFEILEERVGQLLKLGQALSAPTTFDAAANVWNSDLIRQKAERPAHAQTRDLRCAHLGIEKQFEANLLRIRKWRKLCDLTTEEIETLAKIRWQDKIEEIDDDEDEDNEARAIVQVLSKDDPENYRDSLATALKASTEKVVEDLTGEARRIMADLAGENDMSRVTHSLRVIREVERVLHDNTSLAALEALREVTISLQRKFAEHVSSELFESMKAEELLEEGFTTDDLPSPKTISALQKLSAIMLRHGGVDLWTQSAVKALHKEMLLKVADADKRRYYAQTEFDQAYLVAAFGGQQDTSVAIVRRAVGYWGRTNVLFGALTTS